MAAGMFWSVTYSLQQTDSFFLLSRQHHRTAAWVAGLLWRCAACEARRRGCVSLAPLKCRPLHGGTKVLLSWCVGREVGVAAAQKL